MSSRTISFDPARQEELARSLKSCGFIFYENDHAFWRAKSNDLSIIFYNKGIVLLQGSGSAIEGILSNPGIFFNIVKDDPSIEYPVIGLDESGKGDYFGPLVLAAAVLDRENENSAVKTGVMDSKKIQDRYIREIHSRIKDKITHKVRIIEPHEYNSIYKKYGNLNLLMTYEYINLAGSFKKGSYKTLILDKFSQPREQNEVFRKSTTGNVIITEKAEVYPAVAAASILARFYFIDWICKKSSELKIDLPLGCGSKASALYRKMKSEMPADRFEDIAKSHFKAQGS